MSLVHNELLHLLPFLLHNWKQKPSPSLHLLFNALVINKPTYALSMYVNLLPMINAISRKAMCHGLTLTAFDIDALIYKSDSKLVRQATQPGHSLHHLLPPKTFTYSTYQLRKRHGSTIRISFPPFNICSLKIVISIVVYLNVYNLPVVTSCCVSLVFS